MDRLMRLAFLGLATFALLSAPAAADQILGPGRIDGSNRLVFPGSPPMGSVQSGKFISKPESIQLQGSGSVGDVSGMSVSPRGRVRSLVERARDEVWASDFPGFDGTGVADSASAIQAAVNACPTIGCTIRVPTGTIKMGATVTLKSGVALQGTGQAPGYSSPTRFVRAQTTGPMFLLPGTSQLTPGPSTGIKFADLTLDGASTNQPIIYAPEANPGRGSWNVDINGVTFSNARPAIQAVNAWDWWVRNSAFIACGNMPSAVGTPQASCIHVGNSAQSYSGANSNSWRITDNYIDTHSGRGIVFADLGGPNPSNFMSITGNHFGVPGYESIYGALRDSRITGNLSEGSGAGYSIFNLTTCTGCGFNTIVDNHLAAPGAAAIVTDGVSDLITANFFSVKGSIDAWIKLGVNAGNVTVTGNKSDDRPCCNTIPMVIDLGSLSTVFNNDGSDGLMADGHLPMKRNGSTYTVPTDLSYLRPAQSTVAGLPTCNLDRRGQLRVVYDASSPTWNAAVTGGGLVWVTVLCNGSGVWAAR